MNQEGTSSSANGKDAALAVLPFALFGLTSMVTKLGVISQDVYFYLAFYVISLLGLSIGLARGVPRWTYAYLGWSLVYAVWIGSLTFGVAQVNYGWLAVILLLGAVVAALLWSRSLDPLVQAARGIWRDWTLLSLMIYTFVGFLILLYDENHSPYLLLFVGASTLAISVSVWFYMTGAQPLHRFGALVFGFFMLVVIERISGLTWDVAAYYGFPAAPPASWQDLLLEIWIVTLFWGGIMLLPAVLLLVKRSAGSRLA